MTDDQGYGDVGCFGAKSFKTPNLDRLASEGTRFTSFYVAQPVCTASRAALMTGCYSNRVSLFGALNHESNVGIAESELLLPEMLQSRRLRHRHLTANGTSAIATSSCRRATASTNSSACPTPTTTARCIRSCKHDSQLAAHRRRKDRRARSRSIAIHAAIHRSRRALHREEQRPAVFSLRCRTSCRTCRSLPRTSSRGKSGAGLIRRRDRRAR